MRAISTTCCPLGGLRRAGIVVVGCESWSQNSKQQAQGGGCVTLTGFEPRDHTDPQLETTKRAEEAGRPDQTRLDQLVNSIPINRWTQRTYTVAVGAHTHTGI
jgi:hypothetical protein